MELEAKEKQAGIIKEGHLSDEASALLVEALRHEKITDVPEDILTHVEACRGCKEKIMEVVTFLRNPDSTGERIQKRFKYRGKIAAVFVVFALMASAYFFILKDSSFIKRVLTDPGAINLEQDTQPGTITPTEINTSQKKSAVQPDNKGSNGVKSGPDKRKSSPSLPSRYQVNPNLENMIGSRLRSLLFEVLEPANDSVVKNQIHFSWKKELANPHTLKIVNNLNEVLYTYSVKGNSFDFLETLSPGLYYWKLESQNELLYVGKFFIK